jgi:hypothetical protein
MDGLVGCQIDSMGKLYTSGEDLAASSIRSISFTAWNLKLYSNLSCGLSLRCRTSLWKNLPSCLTQREQNLFIQPCKSVILRERLVSLKHARWTRIRPSHKSLPTPPVSMELIGLRDQLSLNSSSSLLILVGLPHSSLMQPIFGLNLNITSVKLNLLLETSAQNCRSEKVMPLLISHLRTCIVMIWC